MKENQFITLRLEKQKTMRTLFTIFALLLIIQAKAQFSDVILGGSTHDAKKYTQSYLLPLEQGMAASASNGVINFTKSKRKISFNIGFHLSAALTPSSDRSFDINSLNLEEFIASDPNNTIAQSISGSSQSISIETKETYYKPTIGIPPYKEVPVAQFDSPEGIGVPLSPVPEISAGIYGFGTHLNITFLPSFSYSKETTLYSYGFSLQHNLETYIKPMQKWPVKLALAGSYQYTLMEYHLDIQPDNTKIGIEIGAHNGPYDNQKMSVKLYSIPVQLIAYHDFNNLILYAGAGYNITRSEVALSGNYPIYVADPTDQLKVIVEDVTDPFEYDRSFNHIRIDLGINYIVGFMKFKASYSYSNYQVFNIGLGVNI